MIRIRIFSQKCGLKLRIFSLQIRKLSLVLMLKLILFTMSHERFVRFAEGILVSVLAGCIVEHMFR